MKWHLEATSQYFPRFPLMTYTLFHFLELGIQKNLITSIPPTERWERDHPENGRHRSPKNKRKRKHDEQPTKSMEDRDPHDRKEDNGQVERVVTKSARPPTIPPTTPWTSRWKQKPIVMRFVGESSDEDN